MTNRRDHMSNKGKMFGLFMAGILLEAIFASILFGCSKTPAQTTSVPSNISSISNSTSMLSPSNGNAVEVGTIGKYSRLVTPLPIEPGPIHGPWVDLQGEDFENSNFRYILRFITKPVDMVPFAHSHNIAEFMMFYGSNPRDISNFKAEIECYIGEGQDQERFVINSPTVLFFPSSTPHCPLNFKIIDDTITMVIIALTPRYDVPHEGHL
jgi:hypothetical protein